MSLHYLAKLLQWIRLTFCKLLMVFMGVSKFGKMNPTFVAPGVNINRTYCHNVLLSEQLYCLTCVISLASALSSSKAVLLHTETVRQLVFWNVPCPSTVQIWTWLPIIYRAKYSSGSTRQKFMTWMNRSSVMTCLIIAPYEYSYSLTDQFLVDDCCNVEPLLIFGQNFNTNCRSPWAITRRKHIAEKFNPHPSPTTLLTADRRQTYGSWHKTNVTW